MGNLERGSPQSRRTPAQAQEAYARRAAQIERSTRPAPRPTTSESADDPRAAHIERYTRPAPVRAIRVRRRRGRAWLFAVLLVAGGLIGYDAWRGGLVPLPSGPVPSDTAQASVVESGAGTFTYSAVDGQVAGQAGPVQRYQIAVEDGIGVSPDDFGAAVEGVLSDARSWTADGSLRLQRAAGSGQRVSASGPTGTDVAFVVLLASPAKSAALCREDGMDTQEFTNCRLHDGRVVINAARWLTGVQDYGAPLSDYRNYVINHEVGHQLGHGHELCPGPGQPAPVMQQQTLGLKGCTPYGWPFRDGARYSGPLTND